LPDKQAWRRLADEWLSFVQDDLAIVKLAVNVATIPQSVLGFHAQQAIDKALKAALAGKMIEPPRTHNLRYLADRVQTAYGLSIDALHGQDLTRWGTAYRYPGSDPVEESLDRKAVLRQVEACLRLIRSLLEKPSAG
jgi:HEPN domain-containing protein